MIEQCRVPQGWESQEMAAIKPAWLPALVLMLSAMLPGNCSAGDDCGYGPYRGPLCRRETYSRWHYWAPQMYKLHTCYCNKRLDAYPPNNNPPVPYHSSYYECSLFGGDAASCRYSNR